MFIYSGNCRFCETGLFAGLKDDANRELYTGDIVIIYTVSENLGISNFNGLTIVVADHYKNVSGKEPEYKKDKDKRPPFVMGIADCDIQKSITDINYPDTVWRAHRVKSYKDVIDGEKWKDYGFRYSEI